jgi:hypothetical protein
MLYSSCTARSLFLHAEYCTAEVLGKRTRPDKNRDAGRYQHDGASVIDRRSFLMTSAEQLGLFGELYLHTGGGAGFSLMLGINAAMRCTADVQRTCFRELSEVFHAFPSDWQLTCTVAASLDQSALKIRSTSASYCNPWKTS